MNQFNKFHLIFEEQLLMNFFQSLDGLLHFLKKILVFRQFFSGINKEYNKRGIVLIQLLQQFIFL